MTNPGQTPAPPSIATCLRCGRHYSPAAEGDALFCGECAGSRPRVSVTAVLIAINVLVFIAMAATGVSPLEPTTQDLLKWGASYGPFELSTEWWRVFTAMFVHIGFLHILLNMYCLWSLGPLAERLFGPRRFALLYLLSGVGGNVASVALHPTIVAAGASGAIFGVAGALLPVLHLRDIPAVVNLRGRRGRLGIGGFIVYNLVYGFANTGIDNAAHIGGLVIGFVIGYAAPVAGSHTGREAALRTRGVLLATALLLAASFLGVRRWRHSYGELERGRRALINGDYAGVIARLVPVVRSNPEILGAHRLLGAAYLSQGNATAAIPEYALALRLDSTDVSSSQDLGSAYLMTEQYRLAIAALQRVLRAKPDSPKALLQRGYAYQQLGKLDSARADYQHVLIEPPGAVTDEIRHEAGRLLAGLADH